MPNAITPTIAPNVPQTATPPTEQTPANFDKLKGDWMGFLQKPEVIAGLLQFGSSMLTPGSNIGTSLGEAAQAAAGTRQRLTEREQKGVETAQKERQVAVQERGATTQEEQNRIAREQLTQQGQLQTRQLDIEQQRANAYAKISALGGGKLGIKERMLPTVRAGWLETAQNMDEFADDPEGAMNYALDKTAEWYASEGIGGVGEAPGEGAGTPGTPPGGKAPTSEGNAPGVITPEGRGYPAIETLTDDQLVAIQADPQALAEAQQVYGEDLTRRLRGLRKRNAIRGSGLTTPEQADKELGVAP
jgi:hypothetical protein